MRFTMREKESGQNLLRPILASDAENLFSLLENTNITDSLAWDGPSDFKSFQKDITKFARAVKDKKQFLFAIVHPDTKNAIGAADIRPDENFYKASIGLWIGIPYQNLGLGTKVINQLLHFGFNQLGLHRVEANVFVSNTPSKKMFEKNGFRLEGILHANQLKKGSYVDEFLFAITKADYVKPGKKSYYNKNFDYLIKRYLTSLQGNRLTSILLDIFEDRSRSLNPHKVLEEWETSRFFQLQNTNIIALRKIQASLEKRSTEAGFPYLDLPPVAPFGSSSSVAQVSQNNILTSIRGTEVVSDTTNILALQAASIRKKNRNNEKIRTNTIRLANSHRLVRAQSLPGPGFYAYFDIFSMISAVYKKSPGLIDHEIINHVNLLIKALHEILGKAEITIRYYGREINREIFESETLQHSRVAVAFSEQRPAGNNYYKDISFHINLNIKGEEINIADGGGVDWMEKFLSDKRQGLVISGIGITGLMKIQNLKK